MSEINRSIKCRVDSCKHYDDSQHCTLPDILVGSECMCSKDKCDTQCASFEYER